MADRPTPRAPKGLGAPGKVLWKSIQQDLEPGLEFDARDTELLTRACRCADELAKLEEMIDARGVTVLGSRYQTVVNPALSEARQARLVLLRFLSAIGMADPSDRPGKGTLASRRGRAAAEDRWGTGETSVSG